MRREAKYFWLSVAASVVAAAVYDSLPGIAGVFVLVLAATITAVFGMCWLASRGWVRRVWRLLTHIVISYRPPPWDGWVRDAASDDPAGAVSAIEEGIAFIQKWPECCREALDDLHNVGKPWRHAAPAVREKYAYFRMVAVQIMRSARPEIIGTLLETLKELVSSRRQDVRDSAVTELGTLCDHTNDPACRVPGLWQTQCFETLDAALQQFLARGYEREAQALIRHARAVAKNPALFRELFSHIVSGALNAQQGGGAAYVEPLCDLVSGLCPQIVYLVDEKDLRTLQGVSAYCVHRDIRKANERPLRVFDGMGGPQAPTQRVCKRLEQKNGEVDSVTVLCHLADGTPCSAGPCQGTSISLTGVNSQQCSRQCETELRNIELAIMRLGRSHEFTITRGKIRRRHTWQGREIPGAGLSFVEPGDSLAGLAELLVS